MIPRPRFPRINRRALLANGLVFAGLGGGASTNQFTDVSGYGNHGTLSADMDPATDWVLDSEIGRYGVQFATSQNIDIPSRVLTAPKTVSLWVNFIANSSEVLLGSATNNYFPYVNGSSFFFKSGGASTSLSHGGHTLGLTYHYAFVADGTNIEIFKNGVSLGTCGDKASTVNSIGADPGQVYGLNGRLSDVMIWDRLLSTSEVENLADPSNVMLSGLILPVVPRYLPAAVAAGGDGGFTATALSLTAALQGIPVAANKTLELTL